MPRTLAKDVGRPERSRLSNYYYYYLKRRPEGKREVTMKINIPRLIAIRSLTCLFLATRAALHLLSHIISRNLAYNRLTSVELGVFDKNTALDNL